MTALLEFNNVVIEKDDTISFKVGVGELLVLKAPSEEAKMAIIDMALGEMVPEKGEVTLQGRSLAESIPGNIGWIPAAGGMISNLKAWENITLPLWYHGKHQKVTTEGSVARLLNELGVDKQDWGRFMASPSARLSPLERKMAGLLRGLVNTPKLLLIDAGLFEDVEPSRIQGWISILEKFVREVDGRAVLAVTSADTLLPWKIYIATKVVASG
jgi:phospholipid/cholesterol/gamma-HCH transport system ATP-binding protein